LFAKSQPKPLSVVIVEGVNETLAQLIDIGSFVANATAIVEP